MKIICLVKNSYVFPLQVLNIYIYLAFIYGGLDIRKCASNVSSENTASQNIKTPLIYVMSLQIVLLVPS